MPLLTTVKVANVFALSEAIVIVERTRTLREVECTCVLRNL